MFCLLCRPAKQQRHTTTIGIWLSSAQKIQRIIDDKSLVLSCYVLRCSISVEDRYNRFIHRVCVLWTLCLYFCIQQIRSFRSWNTKKKMKNGPKSQMYKSRFSNLEIHSAFHSHLHFGTRILYFIYNFNFAFFEWNFYFHW